MVMNSVLTNGNGYGYEARFGKGKRSRPFFSRMTKPNDDTGLVTLAVKRNEYPQSEIRIHYRIYRLRSSSSTKPFNFSRTYLASMTMLPPALSGASKEISSSIFSIMV